MSRPSEYGLFTPFAQADGHVPLDQELNELLQKAAVVLRTLEGISDCHTAAKRFVEITGLGTYRRGWYTERLWEHSWIEFPTFVLDIYPVGGARPLCVAKIVADVVYLKEIRLTAAEKKFKRQLARLVPPG